MWTNQCTMRADNLFLTFSFDSNENKAWHMPKQARKSNIIRSDYALGYPLFYSLLLLMSDDTMHIRFSLDPSWNQLEAVKQEINGITQKNSLGQHKMMKLLIVFESCKEWIWYLEVFVLEVETEKDQEINEKIICHVFELRILTPQT